MMQALIASLQSKQAERTKLINVLAMWVEVKAQGIDPNTVDRFGFDSKMLTLEQGVAIRRADRQGKPDPFTGRREAHIRDGFGSSIKFYYATDKGLNGFVPPVYNYVSLKDGSRVTLDPMIKAPS